MTVLKIDKKILIKLTHIEAISLFGSYQQLSIKNSKARAVLNSLIKNILYDCNNIFEGENLTVNLSIKQDYGCEIYLIPNNKRKKYNQYIFSFSHSECLTNAIIYLYKFKTDSLLESDLYKLGKNYHLILKTNNSSNICLPLNEFGKNLSNIPFVIEYIKEYGKPIILKSAVFKYGSCF